VDEGTKKTEQRYETYKQRLFNQPRTQKFLKRLEQHRGSPAMLEDVANKFVAGQHGEGEIRSAVCCELLRNSNSKAILKRIADLRSVYAKLQLDLSYVASEIDQLKSWEVHQALGYEDWTEFSEKVLGLSSKVAGALLLAHEQVSDINLDHFFQSMIKGYVAPGVSQEKQPLTIEELLQQKSDPKSIIHEFRARLEC
jgi:hypothetical protein